MRFASALLCTGLLAGTAQAQVATAPGNADAPFFEQGKIRVLILSGRNNHDWRSTTPFLKRILEASGRFDVRVTEEPSGLTSETLRPYDVLVSDYCGPRWGATAEQAVAAFVRSGKGLAAVHAASYPFGDMPVLGPGHKPTGMLQPAWPEWAALVGASWSAAEPKTGHAPRHLFDVQWRDLANPIAAGLAPTFRVSDELYHNQRMRPGVQVLAAALDAQDGGGTGRAEPLLWTNPFGAGRVFYTALGHDVAAMSAPGFVVSFARGVEWAATGKVTLPAAISLDPKDQDALRVLLVTGGHSHEQSFYAVLDGRRDMRVEVNPHPVAFNGDLVKAYDVIVLYDFVQDIPDAQRKNLQTYLESGKGLVVLHHAIADYQKWPWWWREVVGGRYLLQDEPSAKASTYLHDQDVDVTPVGHHPIVQGLPPMLMHDETYKGMWHAPGLEVLLTTNHPTSDPPLAWIGPWQKSRVVYIQLGHGREAHENPWYRELVARAVRWSAGR
jgi:type 1 glutamine amidotransferase